MSPPLSPEALELAGHLYSAWPAYPNIPAASITSAAEDLERAGLDIAAAIVERLRTYPAPVSHGEIVEMARRVRLERHEALEEAKAKALPAVSSAEEQRGSEIFSEGLRRLREQWASDEPEPVPAASSVPEKEPGPPYRGCSGAGKRTVIRDGHAYCPGCNEDVCQNCVPVPRPSRDLRGAG